jgi:Diphthamide synthase
MSTRALAITSQKRAGARTVPLQGLKELHGRTPCPPFVGRTFDEALLRDLPPGVDPCGENGELHTFVHAGPIFREPVAVKLDGRRGGRAGAVLVSGCGALTYLLDTNIIAVISCPASSSALQEVTPERHAQAPE